MDNPFAIAVFSFGAVLLLIALLKGGFKLYGAEISGGTGLAGRLVAGLLGLVLVLVGVDMATTKPTDPAQLLQDQPTSAGSEQQETAAVEAPAENTADPATETEQVAEQTPQSGDAQAADDQASAPD